MNTGKRLRNKFTFAHTFTMTKIIIYPS